MSDAFSVVRTEPLLESVVFHVERRFVEGAGETFDRDIVVHSGAVSILPIADDGSIGLLRQYRASQDQVLWELPAGTRDVPGEPEEVTAAREMAEEMGLQAQSITRLCRYLNSPGWTTQATTIFVARGLSTVERAPDGPEESSAEVVWLSRDEACSLLDGHEPLESATMIALLHVCGMQPLG